MDSSILEQIKESFFYIWALRLFLNFLYDWNTNGCTVCGSTNNHHPFDSVFFSASCFPLSFDIHSMLYNIYRYIYMKNTQHGYKILTKILTKTDNIFQFHPVQKSAVSNKGTEWTLLIPGQLEELFSMDLSRAPTTWPFNETFIFKENDNVGDRRMLAKRINIDVSILYTYPSVPPSRWENTQRLYHIRGATAVYEGTLTFWLIARDFLMSAISRMKETALRTVEKTAQARWRGFWL